VDPVPNPQLFRKSGSAGNRNTLQGTVLIQAQVKLSYLTVNFLITLPVNCRVRGESCLLYHKSQYEVMDKYGAMME
jgi:hypothetical protein